jgi:dTDP-4-dehydrorhamnose 3,5-epimerase
VLQARPNADSESLHRTTRSFKDYTRLEALDRMNIVSLDIPNVKLLRPQRFRDARGVFCEIYNRQSLSLSGVSVDFVQDNCSVSQEAGTIRGLHFQAPPMAQAKLIMVLKGRVRDVVVDCRKGSPTYGNHMGVELDGENWHQLFVPEGFAHGFCTLEPNTIVLYKVSAPYASELDSGILWNDPDLGIDWPVAADQAVISDKDKQLLRLRDLPSPFSYGKTA